MFMGEYRHSVDDKGRLIMPAKFREGLGQSFVVTRGLDQCLFAYPRSEWTQLEQKCKTLPFTKADKKILHANAGLVTFIQFLGLLNPIAS